MNRTTMAFTISLVLTLLGGGAQANSSVAGVPVDVNINRGLGGVLVEMAGSPTPTFEAGSACAGPWAYIATTDPLYSSVVAALMSAKLSSLTITIVTSGCNSLGFAQISAIEFGTRMTP